MGAGMAMISSYVLAGELAAAGGDHRVAFARYEAALRPYVTQCQKLPPGGVNGIAPKTHTAIRLRALSTRVMTRWPMRALIAKMFERADGFALTDYPVPAER